MRIFRPSFFSLSALLAFAFSPSDQAQTVAADSPFLPANGAAIEPHGGSNEPFQLVGIGVVADKVSVCIYDAAEKRSRWIAVGASLGDLRVVSCDVEAEQAVIRIGDQSKTLTLPKPTVETAAAGSVPVASMAPSDPSAANPTASPAVAPGSEEDQAREARMFVTDILEISMQQRKAYEDAQRKAAEQPDKPQTETN